MSIYLQALIRTQSRHKKNIDTPDQKKYELTKKVVRFSYKNNNTKLYLDDHVNLYNCKSVKGVLTKEKRT